MLTEKQKHVLHIFDVIEFIFTICATVVFTILTIIVNDTMKYGFLGGLFLLIYHLFDMFLSMKKNKKRVIKYSKNLVEAPFLSQISI